MELTERKRAILKAVVEDHIDTAEPVGSKALTGHPELSYSSATIRNEMSELEEMGYLEQPHTSAGRVPTPKGYRMYVNELMKQSAVSVQDAQLIKESLERRIQELDRVLSDAGKLTSRITQYPSYALQPVLPDVTITRLDLIAVEDKTFIIVTLLSNKAVKNRLVTLPFEVSAHMLTKLSTIFNASFTSKREDEITPELIAATERGASDTQGLVAVIAGFVIEVLGEAGTLKPYIAGTSNLLHHPEYKDMTRAQRVLDYLSDGGELSKLPQPEGDDHIKIMIGPENLADELRDSSVIVASYDAGDNLKGLIGVVGPTRMDYSRVASRLGFIAEGLSRALSGGGKSLEEHLTKGVELLNEQEEKQ